MRTEDARSDATRPIRRDGNGAIDIAYYTRRAHELRARVMRRWLRGVIRRIASWRTRQLARRELYALDECALKDIGITRGDIPTIVSGAFFKDDSRISRGTGDHDAEIPATTG